jgi:hypothetical protein
MRTRALGPRAGSAFTFLIEQTTLVKLRFYAGLTALQAAPALGVSTSTALKDWAYARRWLRVTIDRMSSDRS